MHSIQSILIFEDTLPYGTWDKNSQRSPVMHFVTLHLNQLLYVNIFKKRKKLSFLFLQHILLFAASLHSLIISSYPNCCFWILLLDAENKLHLISKLLPKKSRKCRLLQETESDIIAYIFSFILKIPNAMTVDKEYVY